jgi:hypothetical protein
VTPADADAFVRELAPLNLVFPRDELTPAAQVVYFEALRDLTLDQVRVAVARAIRESRFMPKPAELRTFALGTDEERAALAWGRAHRAALKGYGTHRPLDFADPVLHAAVTAMGGWGQLYRLGHRDAEGVDAAVARKEFVELYLAFLHQGVPATTPAALHCEEERAGLLPPMCLNELGEPERPPRPALPAANPEPVEYVPPPPEFKAVMARLAEAVEVKSQKVLRPVVTKTLPTPEEIEAQERAKAAKLAELRRQGLLPMNGTEPVEAGR